MASCYSSLTVNVLEDFHVMTVARKISRLVPPKAMPTARSTTPANAAMEIPPVIILNRFIFFAIRSRSSLSSGR